MNKTQILKAFRKIPMDSVVLGEWLDSHLSLFEKAIREETLKEGFYETFKKELPVFHSDDPVPYVVGECSRAAKRAEMKVTEQNKKA